MFKQREQINIKCPHHFSGLYGIEIHSKDQKKVEKFHDFWMEAVGKEWQIFFQGGSLDYPTTDWVFFEFWVPFNKTRMDQLTQLAEVLAFQLELELGIF
jgi:hypothetical protein